MRGIDQSRLVLEEAIRSGLMNEVSVILAVSAHTGLQYVETAHPKLNSVTGCEKA